MRPRSMAKELSGTVKEILVRLNLAPTFLHNPSAWQAPFPVLLLMNLRPLSACCALHFVR
jgi:hypothetical protein